MPELQKIPSDDQRVLKYILVNYEYTPWWVFDYTDDFIIYDRSESDCLKDFPKDQIIKTRNVGNADYDRLSYLVDNYYNLPEIFVWSKSNLFKYISEAEFNTALAKNDFCPLLTQNHKVYEPICRYKDGMYEEINNSWYLGSQPSLYFKDYPDFAKTFNLPSPEYLQFPPGGNFILTKERVHKHPIELYDNLRNLLPYTQLPGEAQMLERTYYNLWK